MHLIVLRKSGPVLVCGLDDAEVAGGEVGENDEDEFVVEDLVE